VPLLVEQLVEPRLVGDPDVVDEAVDPTESLDRPVDERIGPTGLAEVAGDVERLAHPGAVWPTAGGHDPSALLREHPRRLETDAGGRAGDDAHLVAQAEVHRATTLPVRDRASPRSPRRDRLEPRGPLAGPGGHSAERRRTRAGAGARRCAGRGAARGDLRERPPPRLR